MTAHPDLAVEAIPHPQGCRAYRVVDRASNEALWIDLHLDHVQAAVAQAESSGARVRWVLDTHTHADHPSGASALAGALGATRVAHRAARHNGVTHRPDDGEPLALGDHALTVRHTPGHTPDHVALVGAGAAFTGDSLFIGAVARADFLGGDAGTLYDSIHDVLLALPDDTVVHPGHDYAGRAASTIGDERATNPWLQLADRDAFVTNLTANAPAEPTNMAALLDYNRDDTPFAPVISAQDTVRWVTEGGAGSVIDVRTDEEVRAAHIPGSRHIVLDEILDRADEVMATPAPRLILCKMGVRAEHARQALAARGLGGLRVIAGGIVDYVQAGGATAGGDPGAVASGGGCCAALPPDAS